jgi:hypothetical protein
MRFRFGTARLIGGMFGCAAVVAASLTAARADSPVIAASCPNCPCPTPFQPYRPGQPYTPGQPYMPGASDTGTPTNPANPANPANPQNTAPNQPSPDLNFAGSEGLASGAQNFAAAGGYIDDPMPRTNLRLRYDAGFGMNRPDRAEFFYAAWKELSFHPHAVQGGGVFFDAKARGPEIISSNLDFQEASAYGEYAFSNRFSAFADVPFRYVHWSNILEDPDREAFREPLGENVREATPHTNFDGLSDIQVGFKAALVADPDQYLTFQFRTFIPTGNAEDGLGTGHVSVEPDLLVFQRLSKEMTAQGQFGIWVPIGGGAASGPILIYGAGVSYDVYKNCNVRVAAVQEWVGWTVLYGFAAVADETVLAPKAAPEFVLPVGHGVVNAAGNTIVNGKIGFRTYFGDRQDLYVGYGHCVTEEKWYKDIVRVEYRIGF